ncbi:MAG: transcriptional regulator [Alphaproteobacteria bacterium CG11_big_fil_rev_8_21_14_0_20_44_7]|nr:MAG: transcriptional regulator [Alphaproteobacteria bacterium CG11_big_fil_rev_8_21_14_0_20_44_7]
MITVEQMKAARALLGWNQQDLANIAKMSKPAIANIERKLTSPRTDTITAIQKAFEVGGIEFIDGGVRYKRDSLQVQVLKGENSLQLLWDDIYETLLPGEERLLSGVDEKILLGISGYEKMIERFAKKNISGRVLAMQGDVVMSDYSCEYRWVSRDVFNTVPYYLYANKYAILISQPEPSVVIIENQSIVDSYRQQFEYQWSLGMKVKKRQRKAEQVREPESNRELVDA